MNTRKVNNFSIDKTTDPVVIVGAGPGGLLAALVLEKYGTPFILLERATSSKVCSNAGSGFDLAPTALKIMKDSLGLPIDEAFSSYEGFYISTTSGKLLRDIPKSKIGLDFDEYGANRSTMQNLFLDNLLGKGWRDDHDSEKNNDGHDQIFRTKRGTGELHFGVKVQGYEESDIDQNVSVILENGIKIVGSVLLGCDGIHSVVRKSMIPPLLKKGEKDNLNFCNVNCWWGKTDIKKGSELSELVENTQTYRKKEGDSLICMIGSKKRPGAFYCVPTEKKDVFTWVLCLYAESPPVKSSSDLTRRGGFVLNDKEKKNVEKIVQNFAPLIKAIVRETPASAITNVGLFDRENLELPYASGKVALLGDAAHPQSPFMGQGCNMAIVDAYVIATRLSKQPVPDAICAYNSKTRRQSVNKVIKAARSYGSYSVSTSHFVNRTMRLVTKYIPMSMLVKELSVSGDKSNADFVHELHKDLLNECKQ